MLLPGRAAKEDSRVTASISICAQPSPRAEVTKWRHDEVKPNAA
jgi:hypothetical protein